MENYSGKENLEWMKLAKNYNKYLGKLVQDQIKIQHHILDYGAGTGTFCETLKQKGYHIDALEIDPDQCMILQSKSIETISEYDDSKNRYYDFIYSLNVLEHIENESEALHILRKMMKDDGILFLYLPAFNILFSSMDKKVGHYRRYTKKMLRIKLAQCGFEILRVKYADSLGFFASLFYKIFDNQKGITSAKSLLFYDRYIFPLSRIMDFFFNRYLGKNIMVYIAKHNRDSQISLK